MGGGGDDGGARFDAMELDSAGPVDVVELDSARAEAIVELLQRKYMEIFFSRM